MYSGSGFLTQTRLHYKLTKYIQIILPPKFKLEHILTLKIVIELQFSTLKSQEKKILNYSLQNTILILNFN